MDDDLPPPGMDPKVKTGLAAGGIVAALAAVVMIVVLSTGSTKEDKITPTYTTPSSTVSQALTPEQRERWDKYRKAVKLQPGFFTSPKDAGQFQILGCKVDGAPAWKSLWWQGDLWTHWGPGIPMFFVPVTDFRDESHGPFGASLPKAREAAQREAQKTIVDYVVVVNLFKNPSPEVIEWNFSKGGSVVTVAKAPKPDLETSLSTFLVKLQTGP